MPDLWSLVWGKPEVDPHQLAEAIERQVAGGTLDFRTRLLIRDSADALESYWGREGLNRWLGQSPAGPTIRTIRREDLGEPKFTSLKGRLMGRTDPETVRQFLRQLGTQVRHSVRLLVGGSVALILPGLLSRATEDIDVVDEIPPEIRQQHALLDQLVQAYGLRLAHFQSHFLPAGWENRLHSLGAFGRLQVFLVDPGDIFLSKLFSRRPKDLDDLRALLPNLDREMLLRRLTGSCAALLRDESLRPIAEQNWYVLVGESLPTDPSASS
jgi:hypothetical protein